ncbi:hypothetical protein [Nocardioides astragali]|uniref:Exo-alpha-sialidase n=1 Tax=Nocardioides astragali TaxID=1776736 RepID=A0ABW2N5Y3_9ACTN|nr:hypothetical protein [Nocardioides astragali]
MRGARWYVMLAALAAVATGCSGDERRPSSEPRSSPSPRESPTSATSATERPVSVKELARLDKLIGQAEFPDRVGPGFELRDVYYTSPTDAVADFVRDGRSIKDWASAVATTDDNWRHVTTFVLPYDVADGFEYVPLADGAVAIRVGDEYSRRPIPPFVLLPGGKVRPLRKVPARPLDAGSTLLDVEFWRLAGLTDRWNPGRLWAVDGDEGEMFPVEGSRYGELWQRVPGRDGAIFSVDGFDRRTQTWRFDTSTDGGRSWTTADVDLPSSLGRSPYFVSGSDSAVGPGHRQAVAMTKELEDLPLVLLELWQTEDERAFRRVPLPWDEPYFGGMAYTPDGALLLAEVLEPEPRCASSYSCPRPGRIWRLAPGRNKFQTALGAPRLSGHFAYVGIDVSGGMIVARTSMRSVAVSRDGHRWTEVTPGR